MSSSTVSPRDQRSDPARAVSDEDKTPIYAQGVLGKRINIEYGKPIPHKSPVLKPGFNSWIVCGASGTGKSTYVLSVLPFIARLNAVIYATRLPNEDLFTAIARWCAATMRDELPPDEQPEDDGDGQADDDDEPKRIRFHVVNDPKSLMAVCEPIANSQKTGRDRGYWSIVIFDDFSLHKGPSDPFVQAAVSASAMLRNMCFHNMTIAQQYSKMINTSIRASANNVVAFAMHDRHAIQALLSDLAPLNRQFTEEGVKYLYSEVCRSNHGYLWMVLADGKAKLYRYLDDSTGLQRIETPGERESRDQEEEAIDGGRGPNAPLGLAVGRAKMAKVRALKEEYDRALAQKNNRLATALYRRMWRLAEKLALAGGVQGGPEEVIDSV